MGVFDTDEDVFSAVRKAAEASLFSGGSAAPRAAETARLGALRRAAAGAASAAPASPVAAAVASKPGEWVLGAAPSHRGYAGLTDTTKEWVRRVLGKYPDLRFTSGYRDPAHNRRVGGVPNSGHTRGVKADFVGTPERMAEVAKWLQQFGGRTLIHDAGSGNHLDVSWEGVGL